MPMPIRIAPATAMLTQRHRPVRTVSRVEPGSEHLAVPATDSGSNTSGIDGLMPSIPFFS